MDTNLHECLCVRMELIWLRGEGRGVLYVYGPDESGFSQLFGAIDELREIARTRYPQAEIHETPLDGFFEVTEKNLATDEHGFPQMGKPEREVDSLPKTCKATV